MPAERRREGRGDEDGAGQITIEGDRFNVTFSLWRLTAAALAGFASLISDIMAGIPAIRMILIGEDLEISNS
ncbi:hypothetical protein ACNHKD_14795 [Methylocystis sp. JAN1]|uniref:hypothetical protein n=1 Tax=Methylocystis sp. JAN1 TaxID=3397211 RepID=UPI003FA2B817